MLNNMRAALRKLRLHYRLYIYYYLTKKGKHKKKWIGVRQRGLYRTVISITNKYRKIVNVVLCLVKFFKPVPHPQKPSDDWQLRLIYILY